nr:hypothetical protein [Burkholderia pseudomallei]
MKFHPDPSHALNTVTAYGSDYVDITLQRHETSVIVLPGAPVVEWPVASYDATGHSTTGAPGSTITLVSWRCRVMST